MSGILDPMSPRGRVILFGVLLGLVILASIGLVYYATRWGPWVIEDSVDYFDTARNFAAGRGLTQSRASGRWEPMHIHPPFYPMLLSLPVLLNLDLMAAVRALNLILLTIAILSLGWGIRYLTGKFVLALCASIVMAFAASMVNNFAGAMSESLYFTLGIGGMLMLALAIRTGRNGWLFGASMCAGLAFLTRFTGITFIAGGGLGLLLWGMGTQKNLRQRLLAAFIFGSVSILPYAGWMLYLRLDFPGVNPGYYDWHVADFWQAITPMRGALVDGAFSWLGGELFLSQPSYRIRLAYDAAFSILLGLLLVLTLHHLSRRSATHWPRNPSLQLALLFSVSSISTAVILVFSYAFVVIPKPATYARITSPVEFGLVLAILFGLEFMAEAWSPHRWAHSLPLIFTALLLAANLPQTLSLARDLHENGFYYTSRAWRSSKLLAAVRDLDPSIPLITNQPSPVLFFTARPAYDMISSLEGAHPGLPVIRYGDNLADSNQRVFREKGAALIVFNHPIGAQLYTIFPPFPGEPLTLLVDGLILYIKNDEGAIYFYPR